jgi:hypothetical protein
MGARNPQEAPVVLISSYREQLGITVARADATMKIDRLREWTSGDY